MLLARTLATVAQADAGKQEEVLSQFMSLIHDVADEKANICHKMMGEQFSSQIEVLRVSYNCVVLFAIKQTFFCCKQSTTPCSHPLRTTIFTTPLIIVVSSI